MSNSEKREKCRLYWLVALNTIAFVFMLAVNITANLAPINGIETGMVSDTFANLFTPAALTFLIWILIYLLLGGFVAYQFAGINNEKTRAAIFAIGPFFIISCLTNAAWLIAWHYLLLETSVLLILILLQCLATIFLTLKRIKFNLTVQKVLLGLPFEIYFGWITVASAANIASLLVSFGFPDKSFLGQIFIVILILLTALLALFILLKYKAAAYALVFVWSYLGILAKHLSSRGYNREYPFVIAAAAAGIILLSVGIKYIKQKKKSLA